MPAVAAAVNAHPTICTIALKIGLLSRALNADPMALNSPENAAPIDLNSLAKKKPDGSV
ncbi:MAG: hypothetical protein R3D27_02310 [Hyphomicrobiaceae bacterium]